MTKQENSSPKKVLVDEDVLNQIRRQQVLNSIEIAINQTHQLTPLLKQVVNSVKQYLPASGGSSIVLWDEESESFINGANSHLEQRNLEGPKRVRRESGATRWIVDNCQTLIVPDVREDPFTANEMLEEFGLQAYTGIPLIVDSKCIGVLYAMSIEKRDYAKKDIAFLEALAVRVAAAVKNVALLEEVNDANDALKAEKFALELSQQKLAESLTQLEHMSEEKSRFFASMSHEIRTPLNAIIGFAELLKESVYGTLSDKQQSAVGDILSSGTHLLELVNDLLDISKLDADKLRLEPTEIDLQILLENSLNYVRPQAAEKNIELKICSPYTNAKESDAKIIVADKIKVRQIILNLLSNAVKYTPDAGTVTLGLTESSEYLSIYVKDTGIGISEEDQSKLFQEFGQIDSELNHFYKGTGLGLVLSKRLAELHGGRLTLQSVEGKGSTFTFELPQQVTT